MNPQAAGPPLLEIDGLRVDFPTRGGGWFPAVEDFSLRLAADEVLAVVGESGSGKSVAMLALMGLLPRQARVQARRMQVNGVPVQGQRPAGLAMVFQEPMASLNPCFTVGWQIAEALATHTRLDRAGRRRATWELLERVGLSDPERRARAFPHQLSGGMCQRVMIAMALACQPRLLIADEPTTALDVTIQAQIMALLRQLRRDTGLAMVLISHDLALVAEHADRVMVQYAGRVMETQPPAALFARPRHPYTAALLQSLPEGARAGRLQAIDGMVPGPHDRPQGCLFAPRCRHAQTRCHQQPPQASGAAAVCCHTPLDDAGQPGTALER